MKIVLVLVAVVALLAATPSAAQHWNPSNNPELRDRVHFGVQEETFIENTVSTTNLEVITEAATFAEAAKEANEIAEWALAEAEKVKDVVATTGTYHTQKLNHRNKPEAFVVRQQLSVSSQDDETLSELVGVLQSRVRVVGIGYSPTAASQKKAEEEQIRAALAAFRARAETIRQTLGFARYAIVNLNVSTGTEDLARYGANSGHVAGLGLGADYLSSNIPPPTLRGGTSKVVGSASGEIQLLLAPKAP